MERHLPLWLLRLGVTLGLVRHDCAKCPPHFRCPVCGDDGEWTCDGDDFVVYDSFSAPCPSDAGYWGWMVVDCKYCGIRYTMDTSS